MKEQWKERNRNAQSWYKKFFKSDRVPAT